MVAVIDAVPELVEVTDVVSVIVDDNVSEVDVVSDPVRDAVADVVSDDVTLDVVDGVSVAVGDTVSDGDRDADGDTETVVDVEAVSASVGEAEADEVNDDETDCDTLDVADVDVDADVLCVVDVDADLDEEPVALTVAAPGEPAADPDAEVDCEYVCDGDDVHVRVADVVSLPVSLDDSEVLTVSEGEPVSLMVGVVDCDEPKDMDIVTDDVVDRVNDLLTEMVADAVDEPWTTIFFVDEPV